MNSTVVAKIKSGVSAEYRPDPIPPIAVVGLGPVHLIPAVRSVPESLMLELARRADYDGLLRFYEAELPDAGFAALFIASLAAVPEIEYAFVAPRPAAPPGFLRKAEPIEGCQTYLRGPEGVLVDAAWDRPGGRGAMVKVVDIEQGWAIEHPDLQPNCRWVSGVSKAYANHGLATLLVLNALENGFGGMGVCPDCMCLPVSAWRTRGRFSLVEAIIDAVLRTCPGDIVLLEAQSAILKPTFPLLPVEFEPHVFAAIRTASALGRIVVEAAGNGMTDIGGVPRPFEPEVEISSGAFIVAGSRHRIRNLTRLGLSNFGARIDFFAPGENVFLSSKNGQETWEFSGSSSASAIVAGVLACLQGYSRSAGRNLLPRDIRSFFGVPTWHVKPSDPTEMIGVMPRLEELLA